MKDMIFEVVSNSSIAKNTYEMKLECEKVCPRLKPGQFLNIKLDGFYLRRPISICDWEDNSITIVYKAVGAGTEAMASFERGKSLQILLPLGNGFNVYEALSPNAKAPLIVGGGAGVAPVYSLCKELAMRGVMPVAVLGFNAGDEVFYEENFKKVCSDVIVATADGSLGVKGFVTDIIDSSRDTYFYACGPEPMLRAIDKKLEEGIDGEMSFEERMGCGFGACMGCSCETKYGSKRICKDGPVLKRGEIIW